VKSDNVGYTALRRDALLPGGGTSIDKAWLDVISSLRQKCGVLMKWWRWALLFFELFLFALILVLPQVDLDDFTFHGGTAPIVAKAKLACAPVLSNLTIPVQARSPRSIREIRNPHTRPAVRLNPHSLLSLFCTLLC
jgi:hypothetical protein